MATIDWTQIATYLADAATLIDSPGVSAIAALGGPSAEGIVTALQALAGVSTSVLATVQATEAAVASGDLATIQAADAKIQASNASLAAQIAAS